jgi:hypothetical protein
MGMTKQIQIPEDLFELSNKEFDKNWTDDKVVIKRMLYGDELKIQRASMKIKGIPGQKFLTADVSAPDWQAMTIFLGVSSAPWGAGSMKNIEALPGPVGNWVKTQVEEFNTLEVKKKSDSGDTSTESPVTTPKSTP